MYKVLFGVGQYLYETNEARDSFQMSHHPALASVSSTIFELVPKTNG
ncbi:hypothetical protein PENANT_c001G06044 [Penicillium antarcticum]|uniref:Uncharacterized protein n=1 Tax=Penicillium antarcticum TaxID=416450 RepID=A0A1V6QMY0_9EURO|nr:hypothetical protein PENANT_c001G06044 [Penicillium antarcticum]